MHRQRIAAVLVSALIGAFYYFVILHFWGMHFGDNAFNKWLLLDLQLPRNHPLLYRVVIYSHDVILNVLLAVPFASMFVLGARLNNWLCIAVAALVTNVLLYRTTEWRNLWLVPASIGFWNFLLALPVAFLLVRAARQRWLEE